MDQTKLLTTLEKDPGLKGMLKKFRGIHERYIKIYELTQDRWDSAKDSLSNNEHLNYKQDFAVACRNLSTVTEI